MTISGPSEYQKFIEEEGTPDTELLRKAWLRAWNKAWETACDECLAVVENA